MSPRIARIVWSESGGIQDLRARPLSMPDLLVTGLAAFRLTRLLIEDDLPPLKLARARVLGALDPDSTAVTFLRCPWCVGWWVSLAVVAAAWRSEAVRKALLVPAASGLVGLLSTADSALGRIAGASVEVEIGTVLPAPARSAEGTRGG